MSTVRHHQPWLHDLQIATHGNSTVLSAHGGFTGGAEGLYVDDRRVLSHLRVETGDLAITSLAASSLGHHARFLGAVRDLGEQAPDPTVELHQSLEVGPATLVDTVCLVSRSGSPVTTTLRLEIGGDGADLAEVKHGTANGPLLPMSRSQTAAEDPRPADAGLRWHDARHRTSVTLSPPPRLLETGNEGMPGAATWDVDLRLGERFEVTVTVSVERVAPSSFDADSGSALVDWRGVSATSRDPRLARTLEAGVTDLAALLLCDPQNPADVFAAAGTPWYLTLFGRDSIWAARLSLPLGTDLALGTLRTLARRQGTRHDAETAEDPGKIPHEVRRSSFIDAAAGLSLDPVYFGTVDATPLWICLLHDAWRWGLPDSDVLGLLPNLERAVDWLLHHASPDGSGLIRYIDTTGHGLANQGWKDSGDSMRTASGHVATAPIALVEAQAYAIEAASASATLLDHFGRRGAGEVRAWGRALTERLRAQFWTSVDGSPVLAMALDGEGGLVDGIGSNMGHALGTGALSPTEAAAVAATVTGPRLLGLLGLATLSHDNPAYNPIGYHTGSIWTHDTAICAWGLAREGRADDAARVAASLVDSAELFGYRWPELYAGETLLGRPVPYPASCRPQAWAAASAVAVVTASLGLAADAPAGRLRVSPPSRSPFGAFRVEGLRFAGRVFSVGVDDDGAANVEGDLPGVEVVIDPPAALQSRAAMTAS
ncbi:glycogen debranching N-terminal domain-containing protein [Humibacillus sp. DSM 29435]|uniref:glycogen debranching N-terminal domain-containing protein n=1 Tax=Humibacillus sp. DSM 29435 TaxID=1869167 RepID=UPI000AF0B48D|nr:glycogen debranching N-terminal domain-containing protein [Humibacillus sp. DSM 29435]